MPGVAYRYELRRDEAIIAAGRMTHSHRRLPDTTRP